MESCNGEFPELDKDSYDKVTGSLAEGYRFLSWVQVYVLKDTGSSAERSRFPG
jgi:hypothetical protein